MTTAEIENGPAAAYCRKLQGINARAKTEPDQKTAPAQNQPPKNLFPSCSFPNSRHTVTVKEIATMWECTDQHVINLIESGKLAAFDVAGKFQFVRVPEAAIHELARRMKTTPEVILQVIQSTPLARITNKRAAYRVPVYDGYETFMRENSNRP